MITRKNDEAVSPVIGVILMVAITVILAAVIAAFVFGMSGNISKSKIVAVTAQQPDSDHITVTYQGGQDAGTFMFGQVTVTASSAAVTAHATCAAPTYTNSTAVSPFTGLAPTVGSWVTASSQAAGDNCFSGKDHVVATGTFGDGSSQVLLDTYV